MEIFTCASCWEYPINLGANLCIWLFNANVLTTRSLASGDHNSCITWPNALINAPFIPDIVVFKSSIKWSPFTYSKRYFVFDKHCMTLFIKHVFPIFFRPFRPWFLIFDVPNFSYDERSSDDVTGDERWIELGKILLIGLDDVLATLFCVNDERFRRGDVDRSWKTIKV